MNDLERFTASYIEALYFVDTGDDDQPAKDAELAPETLLDIQAECRSFWRRFGHYVNTLICIEAFADSVVQAGYDFYFTRNGHGVGFWEDEWPGAYRELLTNGANGYGTMDIYLGDDGLIYGA